MLSREQFDEIIKAFLSELNHICSGATDKDLRALPWLKTDLDQLLSDLRDPDNGAATNLRMAFSLVDTFVYDDWEHVAAAGFEAYKIIQSKWPKGEAVN